ncbi:abortive infection bacteriophage resistance protein, Abi_2 superfamily [Psychroflexus torquis ATCC 700755]|uniref:Abortive infection bacteriophage resistance protein, Abi_2 superfamily n=1 Tax=Psychroflexus torquis (strain ATCC 700755 / CIP 106069 / ACAM 623) TaxID=313595 RepID=K4IUA2_PSYTT|nr:Abi family protein [Psychroflexus torquis]AFU69030.1 abortive infection bacteriophage resistance protein, Abi_2 superfamily [Psychroflexus torquis ATCC 700755]
MGNIATNTNIQIRSLKKRNLILDYEEQQVKDFLLDIGYYRLGFYWHHFEIDADHNLALGTKLSDVIALYYLDVDLRNILLKYLNRIEINFRTKVVYYVSNKFKHSPSWFADKTIVKDSFIESTPWKRSMLSRVYTKEFIHNNKTLKKHHLNNPLDTYAPAWKTLEFFTFGVLLNLFKNIRNEDIKKRVTESLGVLNSDKFENLMSTVVLLRNICSHGDVLYDFKTPRGLSVVPNIDFDGSDRSSLNATIKVISYFLEHISINRKNDFLNEIDDLFIKNFKNQVIKNIITNKIRYK